MLTKLKNWLCPNCPQGQVIPVGFSYTDNGDQRFYRLHVHLGKSHFRWLFRQWKAIKFNYFTDDDLEQEQRNCSYSGFDDNYKKHYMTNPECREWKGSIWKHGRRGQ